MFKVETVYYDPIRCLLTKQAVEMWMKHKMQITRGFTITLALAQAKAYTGKSYKKTEASFKEAIADLQSLMNRYKTIEELKNIAKGR